MLTPNEPWSKLLDRGHMYMCVYVSIHNIYIYRYIYIYVFIYIYMHT